MPSSYIVFLLCDCKLAFFSRATILVKLEKEDRSQLQYEPGDHIGIYPQNDPELVQGKNQIAERRLHLWTLSTTFITFDNEHRL